jgi:hypothetical protein
MSQAIEKAGFKEERVAQVGADGRDKATTLESNQNHCYKLSEKSSTVRWTPPP